MEKNNILLTFPSLFNETVKNHGKSGAYAFAGEEPISFETADRQISALSAFLEKNGISYGDKVAILSSNMPNWAIAYFSITFMGAVAVPILPDFSITEVANVLKHSGAKSIFVSAGLVSKVLGTRGDVLRAAIMIEDFSFIFSDKNAVSFDPYAVPAINYEVKEDDLASIIYTSGTTGHSKGVMLTHKNISFDAMKGRKIHYLNETDRFLSVLPLSHTYENTLGLVLPMLCGSCVYYLRKPPTPSVLLPALEIVRPTAMLTVPLIIEKVYYSKVLPAFTDKWIIKLLYKIPLIRKTLNGIAGKKLLKTFGGELKFYGIGGAKVSRTVEKFLREAKFPYAVGYGLTETSPLIAGANPLKTVFESTGPAIEDIELKINNPNGKTGEGEIWARGPMVMKGYYKDPEMTAEVMTPDGWFKTGDLGKFDSKNNLFIKGRLKNMIVGASGENIYPEEIESVINNFRYVDESLVIQQKGKLVALVHLNMEEIEKKYHLMKQDMSDKYEVMKQDMSDKYEVMKQGMSDKYEVMKQGMSDKYEEKKEELLSELKDYVNSQVSKFSQINKVVLQQVPFQKTATMKIKRFLYT